MQAADESIGIIFAYTGRISTNKILKKSSIPMFQEMKAVMQLIKPLMRRRGLARMRAVAAAAPSGSHFHELFKRDQARVSQRLSELIAVDTCAHVY